MKLYRVHAVLLSILYTGHSVFIVVYFIHQIGGIMLSPLSEARRRANEKYNAKAYDELKARVKKGEKAIIQSHAVKYDKSLNSFLNRAINETMERNVTGS